MEPSPVEHPFEDLEDDDDLVVEDLPPLPADIDSVTLLFRQCRDRLSVRVCKGSEPGVWSLDGHKGEVD